jgi:uridine kinase
VDQLVSAVRAKKKSLPPSRCAIVGISGIDASGKGYVAEQLSERLRDDGLNVAVIGGDGWLHLPEKRYAKENAGEHFFLNGFRFEELFLHLILPLRAKRTVWLKANHTEQTAEHYRQKIYDLRDIDIAILECVFLFQPAYETYFDLKIWIECRFETALARALSRGQEGLPPEETIADFERIYFPAQRLHMERDNPRSRADIVFPNDSPSTMHP